MSSQASPTTNTTPLPPPCGDSDKAEQYLTQLIKLMNEDKLIVSRTNLANFDPTSLQDHYRLDLKEYEAEISHNKQAETGKDFYVLIFNNLKSVNERCTEKVILAYTNISGDQFAKFKAVANDQIERKRKEAEEKRFKEAMVPIDQALQELTKDNQGTISSPNNNQKIPLSADTSLNNALPAFAASS